VFKSAAMWRALRMCLECVSHHAVHSAPTLSLKHPMKSDAISFLPFIPFVNDHFGFPQQFSSQNKRVQLRQAQRNDVLLRFRWIEQTKGKIIACVVADRAEQIPTIAFMKSFDIICV
jgi:hypothetical protein